MHNFEEHGLEFKKSASRPKFSRVWPTFVESLKNAIWAMLNFTGSMSGRSQNLKKHSSKAIKFTSRLNFELSMVE